MASTKMKKSTVSSSAQRNQSGFSLGAPAQHSQSSRKGKRAWRKNVDLADVEEAMEGLRAEERSVGTILQKKTDDELFRVDLKGDEELFQIDVKGDDKIRRSLPKFSTSLLTSSKILAQRSAVPAVFSRPTSGALKRKAVTHEEKGRLLRMGKRVRKGPFNAVLDHTEVGAGSAMLEVSEAAKQAGGYDVWFGETQDKTKVKHPNTPHPRTLIELPAVPSPHEGTSYNPPLTAHQELLRTAHEIEERRLKGVEELEEVKAKFEKARVVRAADVMAAMGGVPENARTKTKQQRRKAEKLRAEKRTLAEKAARKRMLACVDSAKALRRSMGRDVAARERIRAERQRVLAEKLRQGLAGQKIGRHTVQEGELDVQLGEELSENLRSLKIEGNLFRDRFLSMQHRALIEPRVPVLPKKRRAKIKEYEKHAWKQFDREQ
ncbi:Uncharacterized protein C22F8.09 [Grifola frondosa]|uniref:Ribosome biogenesis protein NOP53 n=1 Tax=Grifola frondosa TaxID=5627 RepID=A0A1C7MGP4_GRIFR|nr:Uncharacterized protein C22F8.09 [Grifola frondosa]